MKAAYKVINNPHKEGKYPIFYNGIRVGTAEVTGDNVLMDFLTSVEGDDNTAVLKKLHEKIESKKASVTSVGNVDYDVINSQDMIEATLEGFVINDMPDYVPAPPSTPPTQE